MNQSRLLQDHLLATHQSFTMMRLSERRVDSHCKCDLYVIVPDLYQFALSFDLANYQYRDAVKLDYCLIHRLIPLRILEPNRYFNDDSPDYRDVKYSIKLY